MSNRVLRTIKQYDKIANEYAKKIENRILIEKIATFIGLLGKNSKVLDVGCAAGRDSKALTDKGVDVIGVDLSDKLLAIAKKKYPYIEFIKADMRKLPFSGSKFDGIWASAVFHHLDKEDMIPTLKEWQRVLKQSGVIYLSTKMGKGKWQGIDELSVGEQREFTLSTKSELNSMLIDAGFSKIKLTVEKSSTRDLHWLRAFYWKK